MGLTAKRITVIKNGESLGDIPREIARRLVMRGKLIVLDEQTARRK